ncbi:MAG TPA: diguanylate cyclase [Actinomycetota bacterium]|nr:diguanylate cyclase [Actinomycetota bacterium]
MDTRRRTHTSIRVPVAWKFSALLALVIPSLLAVSWVEGRGMTEMKERLDDVYEDNLASTRAIGLLSVALEEAEELSLRLVDEPDHATLVGLDARLREDVFPEVADRLNDVRVLSGPESSPGGVVARSLLADWSQFVTLANSRAFLAATEGPSDDDRTISSTVARLSTSLGILTEQLQAQEVQQAQQAKREAERTYAHSLSVLRTIVALGLLAGVSATLWLIRSVVVRTKEYSRFAMRIAAGELHTRIRPRGHDELTDLGWALNEMVARGEAARVYETTQREFTDALQVSETEGDTYGLLKRHLERSIPRSAVVVLNRNNGADRLEATTELPPESGLVERLATAQPRDCLAVRSARRHDEEPGAEPLIGCGLCHHLDGPTSCSPLLVDGEVIGSVLLAHGEPLGDEHLLRVKDSVTQAAPVLANLRNLAIAQFRAATDSLTGLPNARAVQDTLKLLVAQASRMLWPLGAVLLDLDHFKDINDTFGHGIGDEVLAAVGVALQSTVRESDFVGRYGGEEFIMLLPDADRETTLKVAERVRTAIANINVVGGDSAVTASFGVAVFPEDAPDAARLVRNADRAMYRAKANGRNRVEVFTVDDATQRESGPGTNAASPAAS